jgi:alpha-beta hydrolase superfamily lysophospholipase
MWRVQLQAIISAFAKTKNFIIIGHSMGANLPVYNARDSEFNSKIIGLLLLAPAIDLGIKYIYPSMPQGTHFPQKKYFNLQKFSTQR